MVETGLFDRGHFVLVAPSQNHEIKETASSYREHLAGDGKLPFLEVQLERFVAAMFDEGDAALARMLGERYLDFSPIYDLIDDWEPHAVRSEAGPAFDPLRTYKVGR